MKREQFEETLVEAYRDFQKENAGENDGLWASLTFTINSDGDLEYYLRLEASPCYSESEYYGKPGAPYTACEMRRNYNGDDAEIASDGWHWLDDNLRSLEDIDDYQRIATTDGYRPYSSAMETWFTENGGTIED